MKNNYKKIIPCLDMFNARVVKGIKFTDLKDAGDPVEIAKAYEKNGADELCFLDIAATTEGRKTMLELAAKVAKAVNIPLTVGGGIATLEDAKKLINAGVAKVSINSAAVKNPSLIDELSSNLGKERVVVAIDITKVGDKFHVLINGGKTDSKVELSAWAKEVEKRGAGSILLTSLDRDGTKEGYDLESLKLVLDSVKIPVIASGGAGTMEDMRAALELGASAALGASVFHFGEIKIPELKKYLKENGIKVML